jgi:hypothetical protein
VSAARIVSIALRLRFCVFLCTFILLHSVAMQRTPRQACKRCCAAAVHWMVLCIR